MDSGKHVKELKSESLYDSIRKKWAERLTGVNVAGFHETGTNSGEELAFPYPSSSKKDKQLMGCMGTQNGKEAVENGGSCKSIFGSEV